jgi:predicted GH43/DUF377 family glycosyl hydrolase
MNPFVVRAGAQYRLYYAGGDADGRRRICLATSPVEAPASLTRHGVILDLGDSSSFDAHWCVLPCVHQFGDKWHLYYSGHEGSDLGLQAFPGIGLAISDDGIHFERHAAQPVITGDQTREYPDNTGIGGGGTLLEDKLPDGSLRYRMYYTLAVGTPNPDVRIDQEKHCAVCHSVDGVHWTDHRIVMSPRRDVSYEDIAVATPFVWRQGGVYRMFYSGIGTRWGTYARGAYALGEAVSADGYRWQRGQGEHSLCLAPGAPGTWESQMVEYPCVVPEGRRLRLYYCGNGYGATGIGTATVDLEAKTQ